jgi:hypothetical protein
MHALRFRDIGLSASDNLGWAGQGEALRVGWTQALAALSAALSDAAIYARTINGWTWPNREIGQFGRSHEYRAAIARSGIGALPTREALYLTAVQDERGAPLLPGGSYELRLPSAGIPADAFWSLSAYRAEPDGRYFFADNPINRYAVGVHSLGLAASGGVIVASPRPPVSAKALWLPLPDGPFRMVFRAYQPRKVFTDYNWRLPALRRLPYER